jgi:splicing suppressor protein 51
MNVSYCSHACQEADWEHHKTIYASETLSTTESNTDSAPGTPSNASGEENTSLAQRVLGVEIENPFKKLSHNKWLHDRPEKDVYKLLIDTYRLRLQDNILYNKYVDADSDYGGATDGGGWGFCRFLERVQSRPGLLPSWWSPIKADECVELGLSGAVWNHLLYIVQKDDIINHYRHYMMPMQMRIFAEQVYSGPTGPLERSPLLAAMDLENRDGPSQAHFPVGS